MAKGDPYTCQARFESTCPECYDLIQIGDDIIVFPLMPRGEKAFHADCAEDDYLEFQAHKSDEDFLAGQFRGMP